MENCLIELIINDVFNEWKCDSRRLRNSMINGYADRLETLKCIKATNPYTSESGFMTADYYCDGYACPAIVSCDNGKPVSMHNAFSKICRRVINKKFGMSVNYDGFDYT